MSARLCVIEGMGKEPVPNIPAVTRFVREVIGCNCPEEVFRDIEVRRDSSALNACSADCEIRIGGRWYQIESKPEWPRAHYFRVHAANAREYLLKHDLETDEWFLRQQW